MYNTHVRSKYIYLVLFVAVALVCKEKLNRFQSAPTHTPAFARHATHLFIYIYM